MRYIHHAVMDAAAECESHFVEFDPRFKNMEFANFAPKVRCIDKRKQKSSKEVPFTYIPAHLHSMVFELIKNSMRAVLESNDDQKRSEITVVVVDNPSDGSISIKV